MFIDCIKNIICIIVRIDSIDVIFAITTSLVSVVINSVHRSVANQ